MLITEINPVLRIRSCETQSYEMLTEVVHIGYLPLSFKYLIVPNVLSLFVRIAYFVSFLVFVHTLFAFMILLVYPMSLCLFTYHFYIFFI
jgi:integral membrane sensor domain MASE1